MSRKTGLLKALFIVCTLTLTNLAQAVLPDSGWYWNPNEPGRGFTVEIQNDTLFLSAYIYNAQRNPIFLVSGGAMSSDTTYAGSVYQTSNGQCPGCPYQGYSETYYGPGSVVFTGPKTAVITINGFVYSVQRQQFAIDFTNPATPLLGEWAFVTGQTSLPIYFGERVAFRTTSISSGSLFAAGNRAGQTGASNIAVGHFDPAVGTWGILLDSSTSYYNLFTFTFAAFDRIEGTSYAFLKTDSPTSGLAFVAQRIKTGAAAAGQNAPGTGKALPVSGEVEDLADRAAEDQARAIGNLKASVRASPEVQAIALELAAMLRAAAQ